MNRDSKTDESKSITQSDLPASGPRDTIDRDPVKPKFKSPPPDVEPLQPPEPTHPEREASPGSDSKNPNPAIWSEHED